VDPGFRRDDAIARSSLIGLGPAFTGMTATLADTSSARLLAVAGATARRHDGTTARRHDGIEWHHPALRPNQSTCHRCI